MLTGRDFPLPGRGHSPAGWDFSGGSGSAPRDQIKCSVLPQIIHPAPAGLNLLINFTHLLTQAETLHTLFCHWEKEVVPIFKCPFRGFTISDLSSPVLRPRLSLNRGLGLNAPIINCRVVTLLRALSLYERPRPSKRSFSYSMSPIYSPQGRLHLTITRATRQSIYLWK